MPITAIGNDQPEQFDDSSEIPVRVITPEEMIAAVIAELTFSGRATLREWNRVTQGR